MLQTEASQTTLRPILRFKNLPFTKPPKLLRSSCETGPVSRFLGRQLPGWFRSPALAPCPQVRQRQPWQRPPWAAACVTGHGTLTHAPYVTTGHGTPNHAPCAEPPPTNLHPHPGSFSHSIPSPLLRGSTVRTRRDPRPPGIARALWGVSPSFPLVQWG